MLRKPVELSAPFAPIGEPAVEQDERRPGPRSLEGDAQPANLDVLHLAPSLSSGSGADPPTNTKQYSGPMLLPDSARALIESGALAHLVTVGRDGSPQVTCIWVGLDGDQLVSGHLFEQQKLRNVRRDSRVVLSFEGTEIRPPGLKEYLVVHGTAELEEGGAPELLQRLAHVYLGPEVRFPPMDDPPPGHTMRITVERIGGVGPWLP